MEIQGQGSGGYKLLIVRLQGCTTWGTELIFCSNCKKSTTFKNDNVKIEIFLKRKRKNIETQLYT